MDQLWYTWSTAGLGSVIGHRVRAASPRLLNLQDKVYQEIEKYLHYTLPDDINPYNINTASSPYSLTYIATERYGPLLLHRVYAGTDDYGRAGVFFIHVMVNLNDITPLEVIDSWHSPFWQVRNSLLSAEQVELPAVQKRDFIVGSLSVATMMRERINQSHYQKNLEILVRTYLTLENWQNVYLETYAEDGIHSATERNAELIWGLLHCLPPYLAKQVTFSTYEGKLEDHPATRIVATCFSTLENLQREPSHPGFVLKWGYGLDGSLLLQEAGIHQDQASQSSVSAEQLQACATYAHATVEKFLSGNPEDWKAVQTFFDMTLSWKINNLSSFLATYQLFSDHHFNTDNIRQILRPENAVVLLAQDSVRAAVLSFLVKESPNRTTWWEDAGQRLWKKLATYATTINDLRQILAEFATFLGGVILIELIGGDHLKADAYLPVLEIIAPATQRPKLWKQLLTELTPRLQADEQQYPYELLGDDVYQIILKNCAHVRNISNEMIADWLHITWTDIESFCNWDIPDSWKAKAIVRLILHDQDKFPSDVDLVEIISAVQIYYEQALVELAHDAAPLAINHLTLLIQEGYLSNFSATSRFLKSHRLRSEDIEYLLTRTSLSRIQFDILFLENWEYLLLVASHTQIVKRWITYFLKNIIDLSIINEGGTKALLQTIQQRKSDFLANQIEAEYWLLIRRTMHRGPASDASWLVKSEAYLQNLADAITNLQLQTDPAYSDYCMALFRYIIPNIVDEDDLNRVIKHLERALVVPNAVTTEFIARMAPVVGEWYTPDTDPHRLLPYISQAIIDAYHQEKKEKGPRMEVVLPVIFQQLLQHATKESFNVIDKENRWNKSERVIWKKYSQDLRPKALSNLIRKKDTVRIPIVTKNSLVTTSFKSKRPELPAPSAFQRLGASPDFYTSPAAKNAQPDKLVEHVAYTSNPSVQQPQQQLSVPNDKCIAWYGFSEGKKFPLSYAEAQRFQDLKYIYINYVLVRNRDPARKAKDRKSEILRKNEADRLRYYYTDPYIYISNIKTLAHQKLILDHVKGFVFYESPNVTKAINKIFSHIVGYRSYEKYIEKGIYTERDLTDVLLVFLQAYFLDARLLDTGGLKRLLEQTPEPYIKYNSELWESYRQQKKH